MSPQKNFDSEEDINENEFPIKNKRRILIVDDEPYNLLGMKIVLE